MRLQNLIATASVCTGILLGVAATMATAPKAKARSCSSCSYGAAQPVINYDTVLHEVSWYAPGLKCGLFGTDDCEFRVNWLLYRNGELFDWGEEIYDVACGSTIDSDEDSRLAGGDGNIWELDVSVWNNITGAWLNSKTRLFH